MAHPHRHAWLAFVCALTLLAGACATGSPAAQDPTQSPGPSATEEPRLQVMAKLAPLADLASQVAADRGEVHVLVPRGADSHTFEPRPVDARRLAGIDVVFLNGLGLNASLVRLVEANAPEDTPIIRLAEQALEEGELVHDHVHDDEGDGPTHTHDGGDDVGEGDVPGHTHGDDGAGPNPHAWLSVEVAIRYVEVIADALGRVDPDHEHTYRDNAAVYIDQLRDLDEAIDEAVATIPTEDRKLVTFHDSWSYFADRYGLERVAAVQPADFSQPSAAELRRIIDQIRDEDIPAVFGSEVFPSDVLQVISEETGARYVADLADDDLPGSPGDREHSYIGMMVRNATIIVEALGGDTSALEQLDPAGQR